jgi:WS/DGAT/MGAT family acyltransferase
MTTRERMSGVDTAWLRMEMPTNLMMIVGVMMFHERLDLATVQRQVEARFLSYQRFRSRAVQDASGAWWDTDEALDIQWHVRKHATRGALGKVALERLVSDLASTPLDFSRPLWQFHLVDYGAGSALVTRIHHCYADGIALIQVMLSMTHATAAGSLAAEPRAKSGNGASKAYLPSGALSTLTSAIEGAARLGAGLVQQGKGVATDPLAAAGALQGAAKKGFDFTSEITRLLLMEKDAATRFRGALGTRKRVAWATPLPLDEVKVVGKALGASINDVLLSMAAGALRDYLLEKGDAVAPEIRAIVPVNLRPATKAANLGNHFGLVFLALPIGIENPLERLYAVRARMRELKGSYQPVIALGLLSAVGYGPRVLQDQVTQLLGENASAVMTNVPGPQHPLYFAGRRIEELDFWVPQSGGIGMGVSILSYNERIQFGLITDAGLVPDPDRIVGRFGDEFDKLMWIALMSRWPTSAAGPTGPTADVVPESSGTHSRPTAAAALAKAKIPKRFRNL